MIMKLKTVNIDFKTFRNLWLFGLLMSALVGAKLNAWFTDNLMLDMGHELLLLAMAGGALKGVGFYFAISGFIFAGALAVHVLKRNVYSGAFRIAGVLIAVILSSSYWLASDLLAPSYESDAVGSIRYFESINTSFAALPARIAFLVGLAIAFQLAINYYWAAKRRNNQ